MRLIDADKLREALWQKEPLVYFGDVERVIAEAPTVDAIPVEWLEELHRKACGEEAADTDLMDLITNIINIWHYEQGRENDEQG